MNTSQRLKISIAIQLIILEITFALYLFCYVSRRRQRHGQSVRRLGTRTYNMKLRIPDQVKHLRQIVELSDVKCVDSLRMSRNAFGRLCQILENQGGLRVTRHLTVSEQVAIFLSVLAHHKKNCVVKYDFIPSGQTISKHFHSILRAVLRVQPMFLRRPTPIGEECQDPRWRWFKGCLGALDGTHIDVRVSDSEKGCYRNRKGHTSINVLGNCNTEGLFTYVLFGWEGSVADGRVLRDAISRSTGLKVPSGRGNYYLYDNGYANGEGFLTPYRGLRYHLKEWERGAGGPQNARELFNLRHAAALNVIERSFSLLKTRWGILRSSSYYSIDVQSRIIVACCLLHNYVCMEMPDDLLECEVPKEPNNANILNMDFVSSIETSTAWTAWRENLACNMYTEWAEPHINSKIHVWKKFYSTLVSMMGKSGFGWDDSRCMITVDSQDVWDEYCKSWSFFPVWREIFGRDRAEGTRIIETVNEYVHPSKSNLDQTDSQDCYAPTAEWCPDTGYVEKDGAASEEIQFTQEPNVQSTAATRKSTRSSKKRKVIRVSDDDGLSNVVSTFCEGANERLGELSKKFFSDYIEG
ncbi:UNVERIFIED_CONTAM: hypothetical protein Slati_0504200 [Sesamum latifolium]|uniref:Transposase n=1 Tax=Sesamum latifolium TaxID=2727402 RepID=A0AAW2XXQ6_9LAMI